MKESEAAALIAKIDEKLEEMNQARDFLTDNLAKQFEEIYKLGRRVDVIEAQVTKKKGRGKHERPNAE